MTNLKHWTEEDNALHGTFKFKNFTQAFGFLAQVAILQENPMTALISSFQ